MERNLTADRLKGYACLLVLFGHVLIGIRTSGAVVPHFAEIGEKFIWSFHIDLFMFLSGFVFSVTGGAKAKGGKLKFILNKLLNLGIPYFIFSALYIIINSLSPGVNNASSVRDILFLFKTPVAQYWFIYALFFLFVFWAVLSEFIGNIATTVVMFALFTAAKLTGFDLGFLDSSFNCALAFGVGSCLKSLYDTKIPLFVKIISVPLHIAVGTAVIVSGVISVLFVDDAVMLLGIFASICFISLIEKVGFISRFLLFVCKYSFPIYLLHTIFTAAVRIVLMKLGITNYYIHIAIGSAAGLAGPLIIGKICSLTPYLNIFFYPVNSFKKIKKGLA